MGFGSSETISNSLLSSFSSTDSFYVMPENTDLYTSTYEVKAGHWPENYNECVVVLTSNGSISDLTLYTLGLKDPEKLDNMVKNFNDGKSTKVEEDPSTYQYEDFIGLTYKLVPSCEYYTYDKEFNAWSDRSSEDKFMKSLLEKAEDITIVGVVSSTEDTSAPILDYGINYPPSLITHLIEIAGNSEIVQSQLKDPEVDVISGKKFSEASDEKDFDLSSMFKIDTDGLSDLFNFDLDSSDLDLSGIDLSSLDFSDMDLGDSISLDELSSLMPELSEEDIETIFSSIELNVSEDEMKTLFSKLLEGFSDYAKSKTSTDYSKIPEAMLQFLGSDEARNIIIDDVNKIIEENSKEVINIELLTEIAQDVMSGYAEYLESIGAEESTAEYVYDYLNTPAAQEKLSEGVIRIRDEILSHLITSEQASGIIEDLLTGYNTYANENSLPSFDNLLTAFVEYLNTDDAQTLLSDTISNVVDTKQMEALFSKYISSIGTSLTSVMSSVMSSVSESLTSSLVQSMSGLTDSLSSTLSSAFSFSPDAFSNLFSANMEVSEMSNLMISLLSKDEKSFDNNLKKLGYADLNNPSMITIYPIDFDSKQEIKAIIDHYNKRMESNGEEDKVISYTDMVDSLMSSVTDIVNAISYVLIAFVAISLVVSSIMIGVITYISVLERKKEIGILRALGASKHNISQVFNAETFIIGALAGLFGVGITYLLLIPGNAILRALLPSQNIYAFLPPGSSVILVVLSIILTLIGGLIPSRKAAKKDPVIALRTE